MRLNFHSDPGHGWVQTNINQIKELGIGPKISKYSYVKGQDVYLEEDCDAQILVDALKTNGHSVEFSDINYDHSCFIRRLTRFNNSVGT